MSVNRVATRYAKSMIDFSQEVNKLEEVKADMELFISTCEENRDLKLMLKSPIIPPSKKVKVLAEIFGTKVQEITHQFISIMASKSRESLLLEVAKEFMLQYLIVKGIEKAFVRTAAPIDEATRNEINTIAKKMTGSKIEIVETIDEDLIGGFIMRIGDLQYDTSVSAKLRKMERELIES
ncbi:MAG: F-type H+-transporting ATPase subunit delta [Sphingobacteriales bacterium]|jgi:F-type H+-transporting ATPase subunit delta